MNVATPQATRDWKHDAKTKDHHKAHKIFNLLVSLQQPPPDSSLPFDPSALAHAPIHNPDVRVPSKHDVLDTQVKPETAAFVHDDPDGNAAVQSPTVSAFGSRFDASQFAKRRMCKIGS